MDAGARARVGVIGAGRVGGALAVGLARAGWDVAAVANRDPAPARALAAAVGGGAVPTTPAELLAAADLVFLAVPDGQVGPLAGELPWVRRHIAVHCSGALGLDVLGTARAAGAAVGCLHPLQSFPSRHPEPERFRGVVCGVEGAGAAGELLEAAVVALGARPLRLEGVDRALYHAAAVFVSNDVIALAAAAGRAWTMAGLPAGLAREALASLLTAVAANIATRELPDALTGPVARGDTATVERHLAALAADPALRELYRGLAQELLRLVGSEGREGIAAALERPVE
ncbi:MAG: DUF2520 domain-containing protein [Dehalococcoidia bacterium]|nr:DUF2520 domain-containing protein [Dehalococcoidia bacterium]